MEGPRVSIRDTTVKKCDTLKQARETAREMANQNKRPYDVWDGGRWVELVRPSK